MRRAARWDGVCPGKWGGKFSPDEWRELLAYIGRYRGNLESFDAVHGGRTEGSRPTKDGNREERERIAAYAAAGVNWWIEDVSPWRFGWGWEEPWSPVATEQMRERVRQGPPDVR